MVGGSLLPVQRRDCLRCPQNLSDSLKLGSRLGRGSSRDEVLAAAPG